jgi:glycolate oxidase iron-sulfur subunit
VLQGITDDQTDMQHTIPIDQIGVRGPAMADPIGTCVHCGFCLPVCPTYKLLGEEMDSPRGRIVLMKNVLEGKVDAADAQPYVDRCLGCLGCVTACPSGVQYGELLVSYRAHTEQTRERPLVEQLARTLVRETLPYPGRFRAAAALGGLGRLAEGLLPGPLRAMLALLPKSLPAAGEPLPEVIPAVGTRRARVALLTGCVQQALAPQINHATVRVLTQNGVEVLVPRGQGCCGSLGMHTGDDAAARAHAAHNLSVFPNDVDAVITNAAGCGSGMKEYGLLFRGHPLEEQARAYAAKTRDVSEFLDELGLLPPPALSEPLTVAYHDACHLAHAQGVVGAPRRLLAAVPNLTLREIPEGEICCGSAGTYNIEQPELAAQLGARKAGNILKTDAQALVAGNIGCLVQIERSLEAAGRPMPVLHIMEVLAGAYEE